MKETYNVPEQNLELLKIRLAKLTRRCNRIKVQAPVLTVGEPVERRVEDEIHGARVYRHFPVTIESVERPKIDGFEFAAVISPVTDEDGKLLGNVLRLVPGFTGTVPDRYRTATNYCDHCKTSRYRLETFVVATRDGFGDTYKQVGRNCLANYLGLTNPHALAELAQILIDASDLGSLSEDEGGFGGARIPERVPVDVVLQTAASAIRLYGWLSNKSAREFEKTSTSSRVQGWLFGGKKEREAFEFPLTITDEDKALAAETEQWLDTLGTKTDNDYLYNLALLASATSVVGKNFGIVVSAISAYSREKERQIRRNARIEEDTKSQFVGTIGERVTIENAVVEYTTTFETEFGVSHFFKFRANDNVLVYFASNPLFTQGEVIPVFTARVKNHENRVDKYNPNGVKQTIITRATLPKPPKPPLTPEQKAAKKAIAKLRRIQRALTEGSVWSENCGERKSREVINGLIWNIQKENGI